MDFSGSGSGFDMDNFTATNASFKFCAERFLSRPLPPSPMRTDVARAFQFLYLFTCLLLGMSLNLLPIVLVAKFKKLRSLSSAIGLQVMALNVTRTAVETIPGLINVAAGGWQFGPYVCMAHGFLSFTTLSLRRTLMMVLCADRFFMVFWTFQYPMHRKKIALALSMLAWVLTTLHTSLALPGMLDCYTLSPPGWNCRLSTRCGTNCTTYAAISYFILALPSYIIPLVLYIALYMKGRKMRSDMAAEGFTHQLDERERRANITFFLLFLSLFIFSIPTVTVIVLGRIVFEFITPTPELEIFVGVMIYTTLFLVVVDPVVILRSKDFREVLAEVTKKALQKFKMK